MRIERCPALPPLVAAACILLAAAVLALGLVAWVRNTAVLQVLQVLP